MGVGVGLRSRLRRRIRAAVCARCLVASVPTDTFPEYWGGRRDKAMSRD